MFSSSHPKSEARRRPKSGWPLNIGTESRTHQSGHLTSEYRTGYINQNQQGRLRLRHRNHVTTPQNNQSFFCLLFVFAAISNTFTIASHNFHSFKKSADFHKSCIEKYEGIWLGQELWLSENHLHKLTSLGVQFVARSGMEEAVTSGILRGRPFGGVSIAWSPNLNHAIRPLSNYSTAPI